MSERDLDQRIGDAVRAGAGSVRAPDRLHERVARQRGRPPRRRAILPRLTVGAAVTAALAAGFVLVAGGAPSVQQVAAAALNTPTRPAPAPDPRDPELIDARAEGIAFPNYAEPWGWEPVGARTDSVHGRRAVTVVYRRGDLGAHYTIVEGEPLSQPEDARGVSAGGRRFSAVRAGGAWVIAWERDGHTCVLASQTVDTAGLLRMATWR